ncbi:alpha/beta hydrolase [Thermaerobacter litoralis]
MDVGSEPIRGTARPGRPVAWRRWLGWGLALLVVLAVAASVAISWQVGLGLIHPEREPVTQDPGSRGLAFEDVTFSSRDGVRLAGWFLPAAGGMAPRTVIFAHGYGKNRLQDDVPALDVAEALVGAGFNVLMFDFRNSGESGGDRTTVGQEEVQDLVAAVEWVRRTHGPDQAVGLLGWSMGAVTAILAAGGGDGPAVQAVVADAPFSDLRTYLEENLAHWTGLPEFPFNWLIRTLLPPLVDVHPERVRPVEAVARMAPTPLLLIHGTADTVIGPHHSRYLALVAERSGVPVELWEVEGAGHVKAYATAPEAYRQRVTAFFDAHLR